MTTPRETIEGSGTGRKAGPGASEANQRGHFFFWAIDESASSGFDVGAAGQLLKDVHLWRDGEHPAVVGLDELPLAFVN
ncbi:MAG: hypothetical protein ABI334_00420 [Candidatus Dormiibacterota bacterium]